MEEQALAALLGHVAGRLRVVHVGPEPCTEGLSAIMGCARLEQLTLL